MPKFKDGNGTEWEIVATIGMVVRIDQRTGVNVLRDYIDKSNELAARNAGKPLTSAALDDGYRKFTDALADAGTFGRILYAACEKQAVPLGITEDAFLELLDRDTFDAAGIAFSEALVDFFPRGQREIAKRTLASQLVELAAMRTAMAEADKMMTTGPNADPGPNAGANAGNSPESSDSTPAPSPGSS